MLSKTHLSQFKDEESFTHYMDDLSSTRYKEFQLPRFKIVKALGQDVQKINNFIPFIRERDTMNRIIKNDSPIVKKLLSMMGSPRINKNPSTSPREQIKNSSKTNHKTIYSKEGSPHWYFNTSFMSPEKQTKQKIKFDYSMKTKNAPNTSPDEKQIQTQRTTVRRSNIKQTEKITRVTSHKTVSPKLIKPIIFEKKKIIPLPSQVLQPYLDDVIKSTKQELSFQPDLKYTLSTELHDKFIQQKEKIKDLKQKLQYWGEQKTQQRIEELQEYAQLIFNKKS